MAEPLYLLDTDVCIRVLRAKPAELPDSLTDLRPKDLLLSTIVLAELETGVRKSSRPEVHEKKLKFLVDQMTQVVFDHQAARHYGEIRSHLERSGTPIGPLDLLIAAHARSLGCHLVTGNVREFARVPGLKIFPIQWTAEQRLKRAAPSIRVNPRHLRSGNSASAGASSFRGSRLVNRLHHSG